MLITAGNIHNRMSESGDAEKNSGNISQFLAKAGLAAVAGYAIAEVATPVFYTLVDRMQPKWREGVRKYAPHHYQIGEIVGITGILTRNPYIVGTGLGIVASDVKDFVRSEQRIPQAMFNGVNIDKYEIPNILPTSIKYGLVAKKFREIVTEKTYNQQLNVWIPPGRHHPDVITQARNIVVENDLDGHDKIAVLKAIQEWVQTNIHYVYDPRGLDTFYHPYRTLEVKAGDCDDQALLVASMGEALGIPMALELIAHKNPNVYTHVYASGIVNGKLFPLETIYPVEFGYRPKFIRRLLIKF